jgi:5-methylcytosine-specific restriction protein A
MKFGPLQKEFFNADEGAYSIVTSDERKKGQITITNHDGESEILISVLGEANIPRESAKRKPTILNLWRDHTLFTPINLTINFPKKHKRELRIYRKSTGGFAYEQGDVWFIFRRKKQLFVGSLPEKAWREMGRIDVDDAAYTSLIYEEDRKAKAAKLVQAMRYPRDPETARRALESARYMCEAEPAIALFQSRRTGKPYLEPHHLIPMALQKDFGAKSLDHVDNIYALSPHHHRRVHYGATKEVTDVLDRLLGRRRAVLKRFGVSEGDILGFYNCQVIK